MQPRALLVAAFAAGAAQAQEPNAGVIDPAPQFEISPWLYMQFMEPSP